MIQLKELWIVESSLVHKKDDNKSSSMSIARSLYITRHPQHYTLAQQEDQSFVAEISFSYPRMREFKKGYEMRLP